MGVTKGVIERTVVCRERNVYALQHVKRSKTGIWKSIRSILSLLLFPCCSISKGTFE